MLISVTLFDFTDPENPQEPLRAELEYSADGVDGLAFGPKKLVIACGDDVASGNVALPLNVLINMLSELQQADMKRSGVSPTLVGFDKPSLIIPKN
jgi:hypothetical protein